MVVVDPESLYPLEIPSAQRLACQRGCKELDRLQTLMTASQNRLRDIDRFAWPGLERLCPDIFSPVVRFFRQHWYDPVGVVQAGPETLRHSFAAIVKGEAQLDWGAALLELAEAVLKLYGRDRLDYARLQQEVCREQHRLEVLEAEAKSLWRETIRPLYRQLQPDRHLESLYGVGEESAAVYASFIGRVERFPDNRHFRGWHGLVPDSRQSGEAESKGLHVSQAGPDLVKKFAYLDADVARRYDPQIAVIYYDQMVHKGKHHNQAVCACATHLLDRIQIVCRQNRPYQLRDPQGQPITPAQAKALIAERYTVPQEVRRRNNRRARRQRAEQRAERQPQRGSRSRKVRGEPALPHA